MRTHMVHLTMHSSIHGGRGQTSKNYEFMCEPLCGMFSLVGNFQICINVAGNIKGHVVFRGHIGCNTWQPP